MGEPRVWTVWQGIHQGGGHGVPIRSRLTRTAATRLVAGYPERRVAVDVRRAPPGPPPVDHVPRPWLLAVAPGAVHPCAGCGRPVAVVADYCSRPCAEGARFARRVARAVLVGLVVAAWGWVTRRRGCGAAGRDQGAA